MTSQVPKKTVIKDEESEEDKELQLELKTLVNKIKGDDQSLVSPAIEMLKYLIRTSTTSMTSVPKPLKYLAPFYDTLKETHKKMAENSQNKKSLADVLSIIGMGTAGGEEAKNNRECLKYCLRGTMKNIGDWGHEYIRQLEKEIVQQWMFTCGKSSQMLLPLIRDIITFNCEHHAEIQACDLLMEIDLLHMLPDYITADTYQRICTYLSVCSKYVDDVERSKIMKLVSEQFLRFNECSNSLITAIQMNDTEMVQKIFSSCNDKTVLYQLAFICARQNYPVEVDHNCEDYDEICNILNNSHLSNYFITFARELDIMEPKSPEEVYKSWLEPIPRIKILGEHLDSARQNLASSLVNGFVNAGFGSDKLLTVDGGNKWIYRNKDHGMLSATAALGLIHLWDVDGGLTPIDKYLYSTDDNIKSGALLALGIVNCRVRNECDPALALLGDYVSMDNETLQIGAIVGIAMAYAGTHREDVLALLLPIISSTKSAEILGIASVACGLISIGKCANEVSATIFNRILEMNKTDRLKSPFMRLTSLGLSLCYFGSREAIDVATEAMNVLEEPFKTFIQTVLLMCAYAGTGDVLIVQELLHIVGEKVDIPKERKEKADKKDKKDSVTKIKAPKKFDWDYSMGQAMAALAVAVVSIGDDIGVEMTHRIFGHIGRYGDPSVRKVVPLAIALSSVSNPQLGVIDILTKYSHDADDEVASNAIFGLGFVGAGTNNARLAATLRQLAVFHKGDPAQLFMVRFAQGLVHMGKGTLTFNPLHTNRTLVDPIAMAGLLVPLIALVEPHTLILNHSHYLLYMLAAAIQPRWLLTLDENLNTLPVMVRVGQAVDTVGKAGNPRTISGIHTHTTPVLLAGLERAELVTDQYQVVAPTLDGICVLKQVPDVKV